MKIYLRIAIIFSLFFPQLAEAQQNRFVYLQTENKQPFYVRLNDVVYSSSTSGYLVIPKLKDESYNFVVGFPKNEWPQQIIPMKVGKDAGYLLKNFGDKGWGLLNLQSMDVVMAQSSGNTPAAGNRDDDDFTKTLSDVINTPDLNKKPPVQTQEVKAPPVAEHSTPLPVIKKDEGKIAPASSITRILNSADSKGRDMVYIDKYPGGADTIRIFIAAGATKSIATAEKMPEVPKKEPAKEVVKEKVPDGFMDIELQHPAGRGDTVSVGTVTISGDKEDPIPMVNSNCKRNASEDDFLKLRRNIAKKTDRDDMLSVARKEFRTRCYSTEQIRNLGVLFLNDESRYAFFDAAYPFANDSHNFPKLEQELKDPYYITRFQAMVRR